MRNYLLSILLLTCSSCASFSGKNAKLPAELQLVTRADWGAAPAKGEMKKHTPERITIHHTGTTQKPTRSIEDKLKALQRFSHSEEKLADGTPKKAWPDVPYHFYIAADGRIAEGRELRYVGDTNTEYDPTGHLLVTLEGNFEKEQPTEAQLKTLYATVRSLAARYRIPPENIGSHKDYATTACPGENLQKVMPDLRALVQ